MKYVQQSYAKYLPVNEQAILWELYGKDAGFTNIKPGSEYPPLPDTHPKGYAEKVRSGRILREYQVVYITSGKGWFKNSYVGMQEIRAGDIFIIFPEVLHSYSPYRDTGWHEYWVGFSGDHAYRLQRNGLFSPANPIYHIGLDTSIITDFEEIIQVCRQRTPGFQINLGVKILQLLAHILITEHTAKVPTKDEDIVTRVQNLMEFHIDDGMEIEQITSELAVNYQYLLKIFKNQTGFTPYQYYLNLRIARAQDILLHTNLRIKEVAAQMNFENQYYFSKIFKKKTGYSPSDWKAVKDANTHL